MTEMTVARPQVGDWCTNCLQMPNDPCPSCTARRPKVSQLYLEEHRPPAQIARGMRIPELNVLRLIEEEQDRHGLARLTRSHSPHAPVRELVER